MIKSFRKKRYSGDTSPKHSITRISSHPSPTGRHSSGSGSATGTAPLGSAFEPNGTSILQSPKKVIRALYDYEPQGPRELRFKKGDFFHVLNDDEELIASQNGWCEATNPMTQTTGMVPMVYFEVFNRSRPTVVGDSNGSPQATTTAERHSSSNSSSGASSMGQKLRNSNQALYALTLYPFRAERDDELDVDPGENLVICAHHEYEWFIAKPINRLGGPGLVPVSYVKIIDLTNPLATNNNGPDEDIRKLIDNFKIPTVEQWKIQTAKYQASTIPLGSISNGGQQPPHSANSQYFENSSSSGAPSQPQPPQIPRDTKAIPGPDPNSISSGLSMASVVEASVDSYQLDHGRYQYLISAKLSNGKVRYLYRYYQDFYDLQVNLLELFPFEAGKMENLKRIIPSIPGPLINVNDHISKLRREKLDYYLKNLIALPDNISKSDEVLQLFELVDNGFDREILSNQASEANGSNNNTTTPYYPANATNNNNASMSQRRRSLKPISYQSNYQQERLSQYSAYHITATDVNTPNSLESLNRSRSSSIVLANAQQQHNQANAAEKAKVKVKFYYDEDIFVLLLPVTLRLQDLQAKLFKRLNLDEETQTDANIHIYLKKDYDGSVEEALDIKSQVAALEEYEINSDERFGDILVDKCKVVILVS